MVIWCLFSPKVVWTTISSNQSLDGFFFLRSAKLRNIYWTIVVKVRQNSRKKTLLIATHTVKSEVKWKPRNKCYLLVHPTPYVNSGWWLTVWFIHEINLWLCRGFWPSQCVLILPCRRRVLGVHVSPYPRVGGFSLGRMAGNELRLLEAKWKSSVITTYWMVGVCYR